jgi:hypothetical protein
VKGRRARRFDGAAGRKRPLLADAQLLLHVLNLARQLFVNFFAPERDTARNPPDQFRRGHDSPSYRVRRYES